MMSKLSKPRINLMPLVVKEIKENFYLQTAIEKIYEHDLEISRDKKLKSSGYDFDTYRHTLNTANLIAKNFQKAGLSPKIIRLLVHVAIIHDIGKTEMEKKTLVSHGPLTREEKRLHVRQSIKFLNNIPIHGKISEKTLDNINRIKYIISGHHLEDGYSYPESSKQPKLPTSVKALSSTELRKKLDSETGKARLIFAVTDTFEALTGKRNYKKTYTVPEAKEIIKNKFIDDESKINEIIVCLEQHVDIK